jgi:tetratricopeptide (TPR) repeat protein
VQYFDHLQEVALAAGDLRLFNLAKVNYIACLLYLDRMKAIQIYQELQEASPAKIDKTSEKIFWFVLGQYLALMEHAEAWEYASHCFRLSRECMKNEGKVSRNETQWSQALIANGEALIAFKLQQGDSARYLEEAALAALKDMDTSLSFQAHVKTNLGDVFLRMLGDVETAITVYEEALLMSIRARKIPTKRRGLSEKHDPLGQRAAQKLGSALMQVGRYEEAIQVFTTLLEQLEKDSSKKGGEMYATAILKARLALAQAYLKTGRARSACVCYWRILRQPAWLQTDTLKDVAAKLRCSRPEIHERLHRRIDRIISAQEEITFDVMHAEKELASMVCKNDFQPLVSL